MSPRDAKCADRATEPDPAPEARTLADRLDDAGVNRRRFLTFCAAMVATLALPEGLAPRVANALSKVESPVVVWLEFQDCAGDTEAFLRSRNPSPADLLLGLISLDYHETVMAAAGRAAEKARDNAVTKGGHLVVVEGSVPTGIPGACTIGGRSAEDLCATPPAERRGSSTSVPVRHSAGSPRLGRTRPARCVSRTSSAAFRWSTCRAAR